MFTRMISSAGRIGLAAAMVLGASLHAPLRAQPLGTSTSALVASPTTRFWTNNGNVVPMCWHEFLGFGSAADREAVRSFVRSTIEQGWIAATNLRITWEDCPTSGPARHVRVKLRIGDAAWNGTTLQPGMATLTSAADRVPPRDPPGLLMGFPNNWNRDAGTRADFRALILHEFGHVLGFGHEQDRTDGPAGISCYQGGNPDLVAIGAVDPRSIMGWSYCAEAGLDLTPGDVAAAREIYGTPRQTLAQLHAGGSIWLHTGLPCAGNVCAGWALVDRNPATVQVVGGSGGHLYQRHRDGSIWSWDTYSRCNQDGCPGWLLVDRNSATRQIAAGGGRLFQMHADGKLWVWDGRSACDAGGCPGWLLIDRNPATAEIAVAGGVLTQRHADGKIWQWDGRSSCTATGCPGWLLLDRNGATVQIAGGAGGLFQRHRNGMLWKWDGRSACHAGGCPGWLLIDRNPATVDMVAAGRLVQRHANGMLWTWDGRGACDAGGCPGWLLIDRNPATTGMALGGGLLFQRHQNGMIWQWDGRGSCGGSQCPGWTLLDRNPATVAIAAFD